MSPRLKRCLPNFNTLFIMAILGGILMFIGFLIALIYGIQILIIAFKTSVLWGLGSIFIPFVGLIFIIMHWDQTKRPFLMSLLAIPFFIIGSALVAPAMARMEEAPAAAEVQY